MLTLKERLEEVMDAKEWAHADVMRISGMTSSVVSQWRGKGDKEIKSIAKIEAVLRLQKESGYSAVWIATGKGPKFAADCDWFPDPANPFRSSGRRREWPFPKIPVERWWRLSEVARAEVQGFALGVAASEEPGGLGGVPPAASPGSR